MLGMINRGRIADLAVVQEFEHLIGRLRGFLSQSFDADGNLVIADPNLAVTPVGGLIPYAGAAAPTGWLLCEGQQVSRVTYQSLFDAIGTTYGAGDGSTTFNIPDMRQRFPLGKAASGTGNTLGATGGAIDHTHTGPSHTHSISSESDHQHSIGSHTHDFTTNSGGAHAHSGSTNATSNTLFFDRNLDATIALGVGDGHTHGFTTDTDGSHAHDGTTDGNDTNLTSAQGGHSHGGATGAAGTGNTGTANAPFAVFNYIIFAGV